MASVLVLARLITPDFRLDASSISITEVPLREVIAGANIIIVAKVEQIASVEYPNAKDDEPELRVFDLKVEDVLKPRGGIAAELKGTTIRAFDPRDKYQHDHYEQIQAGVVSFVEKRYATKAGTVAEGDHLIFFLNEPGVGELPVAARVCSGRRAGV